MQRFLTSHLSEPSLLEKSDTDAGRERSGTAHLLADIADVEERRSYLRAGYPSLLAWCVGRLKLCDQAAKKRIRAARVARRFPAILPAVDEGRLHLTAVVQLAAHLTEYNAEELLTAAMDKTVEEIERLLAARFPKSDVLPWVAARPSGPPEPPEEPVGACQVSLRTLQNGTVPVRRGRATPLSAESFEVQFTHGVEDHDDLVCAQELLSHEIPSGDLATVYSLAVKALLAQLRKRRYAATAKPRPSHRRPAADSRHIPDPVRRAVWERDGGRCTFVSEDGHRRGSRKLVEFDHIEAFARGGDATVENVRLLCRAHNHYEAERTFGPEFMRHKRIAAAEARAEAKAHAKKVREEEAAAANARAAAEQAHELEVVPYLRQLGYNARESRDAAALCRDMKNASLEARVRVALSYFRVRGTKTTPAGAWSQPAVSTGVAAGP
jgi:5-methylcytosine-specific restriction endonuclease McrA